MDPKTYGVTCDGLYSTVLECRECDVCGKSHRSEAQAYSCLVKYLQERVRNWKYAYQQAKVARREVGSKESAVMIAQSRR
jgi:hypothetical protein